MIGACCNIKQVYLGLEIVAIVIVGSNHGGTITVHIKLRVKI